MATKQITYNIHKGIVTEVEDGDTLWVKLPEGTRKVRLSGIDAPELSHDKMPGQPLAETSKRVLGSLTPVGSEVDLLLTGYDAKYKRYVGLVNRRGANVNAMMVGLGLAEVYTEYVADLPIEYQKLIRRMEAIAQDRKRGIWNLKVYERPTAYRKNTNELNL